MAKGSATPTITSDPAEEIAFIRQKASSLSIRGHYSECIRLIEENLKLMYLKERWPEGFFSILQIHKRCYPSLNRSESYEEYADTLLKKNDVPVIFAKLLRGGGKDIVWKGEYFREKALEKRDEGDFESALDYADILIKIDPHSSNAYLVKGWILDNLGRNQQALESFEYALELMPSNLQASQGVASQYGKTDVKKALAYLDRAMADFPDEDGFVAEKARLLKKNGDHEGALAMWDKAMEIDPYRADYPYEKAELLLEGNEIAAITLYNRAIGLNEKHAPSHKRLAKLNQLKNPKAALEHMDIVVKSEPGNLDALLFRGDLLRRLGNFDIAIKQYKNILVLNETHFGALEGLARCYRADNPQRSLEYYDQALKASPDSPGCHIGRGEILETLDRKETAIQSYKAASALDSSDPRPFGALGRLYTQSDPSAALGYFKNAVSRDAENPDYHTGKAESLLILGREAEATESLDLACKYDPGNAELHQRVAKLLENSGNRASSLIHYQEAVSLNPDLDESHLGIARQLARTEPHVAVNHINTSIRLDRTNANYYYWKAEILASLGNDSYALERLRSFMETESKSDGESLAEISELLKGDSLRIALYNINRALELAPGCNTYLCLRGKLLYDIGQVDKALSQFKSLLESDPDNHEALYGLGNILFCRGKTEEAIPYLDRAISLCPKTAVYLAKKAACLSQDNGRYEEAIACYDAAIPLDTFAWEPVLEKAQLMDAHGDFVGAMDSYRRTLLIHSACLPATVRMGELLADSNPLAALNYFRHAIALDADNWIYFCWVGRVYRQMENLSDSRQAVDRAVELGGDNPEIWFALARVFADMDWNEALTYCERSLHMDDSRSECHILMGDIYLALDRIDHASSCYETAARLDPENVCATARAARVMLLRMDEGALDMIDLALKRECHNIEFLCLKADILVTLFPGMEGDAVAVMDQAVKLSPNRVDLRERLVGLLAVKRSFIRLAVEKARLERLRHRQGKLLAEAKEIKFEAEESEEPAIKRALESSLDESPDTQTNSQLS